MRKQLAEQRETSGGREQTDGSGRFNPPSIKWVESKIHATFKSPWEENEEGVAEEVTSQKRTLKRKVQDTEAPDSDSGFFTDVSGRRRGPPKATFDQGIKQWRWWSVKLDNLGFAVSLGSANYTQYNENSRVHCIYRLYLVILLLSFLSMYLSDASRP